MANQFRSNLKKNDRFSWILDDLLLNSVVEPESSAVKCRSVLKVWNLSMTDENGTPRCVRTIPLFNQMEEEVITAFAVGEEEEMLLFGTEQGHVFYFQVTAMRVPNRVGRHFALHLLHAESAPSHIQRSDHDAPLHSRRIRFLSLSASSSESLPLAHLLHHGPANRLLLLPL